MTTPLTLIQMKRITNRFSFMPNNTKQVGELFKDIDIHENEVEKFLGWMYGAMIGSDYECKCWGQDVVPFLKMFNLTMKTLHLFYFEFKDRKERGMGDICPVFDKEFSGFPWSVRYFQNGSIVKNEDIICTVPNVPC